MSVINQHLSLREYISLAGLIHKSELLVVHGTVTNANLNLDCIQKYSFNLQ